MQVGGTPIVLAMGRKTGNGCRRDELIAEHLGSHLAMARKTGNGCRLSSLISRLL